MARLERARYDRLEWMRPARMGRMRAGMAKNRYFARQRRKQGPIWRNILIMRAATAEAGNMSLLCTLSGETSLSWRAK